MKIINMTKVPRYMIRYLGDCTARSAIAGVCSLVLLSSCITQPTQCSLVATRVDESEGYESAEPVPEIRKKGPATQSVDLGNVLALGGADNIQIALARSQVVEAHIDYRDAKSNWLPSLRFGIGWNQHNGRIQSTTGQVIEADRNSRFIGGGAGLGDASVAGGSGGPSRLAVNMSLADAFFKPIIAHRNFDSTFAAECATINDSLLQIALTYFDLVEAHGLLSNASVGLDAARKMVSTSSAFENQGLESPAEVQRARTDYALWQQQVLDADRKTVVASTELARLLHLDPATRLIPVDEKVVPIKVVDTKYTRDELIEQGLTTRPEVDRQNALIASSQSQVRRQKMDLLLPSVQAGVSGGNFGGGPADRFNNEADRSDVDLMAVWELKNLGAGHVNAKRRREVQLDQALLQRDWMADKITSEIVTAKSDADSYRRQISVARTAVVTAGQSYSSNQTRIAHAEGRPIELLQAIHARSDALDSYTKAVSDYNRAQYRLLRAIGSPPGGCMEE